MAASIAGPPHISFPISCFSLLLALLLMTPHLKLPFHNTNSSPSVLGVLTLLPALYPCFPALMPTSCFSVIERQQNPHPDSILSMYHPQGGNRPGPDSEISSGLSTLHQFNLVLANMGKMHPKPGAR